MRIRSVFLILATLNVVLIGFLLAGLKQLHGRKSSPMPAETQPSISSPSGNVVVNVGSNGTSLPAMQKQRVARATPFTKVYSPDLKQFAANLRSIHCPEETVKDIISAEVDRRFRPREEALCPKPADHVPYGWSARTSEPRLLERRQQAATLAREKAAVIQEALGYEAAVSMPVYAMTTSEQRFAQSLTTLASDKQRAAQSVHEAYWTRVQALCERTKGFWQASDVSELDQLKRDYRQAIASLTGGL